MIDTVNGMAANHCFVATFLAEVVVDDRDRDGFVLELLLDESLL